MSRKKQIPFTGFTAEEQIIIDEQWKYYYDRKKAKEEKKQKLQSKSNRENAREERLKREYGITLEQHKHMFISQNGCCAICENKFTNRKHINVDHNHITGQVRQLLCTKCNGGIGYFNENPTTLQKAIEYINKWNTPTELTK